MSEPVSKIVGILNSDGIVVNKVLFYDKVRNSTIVADPENITEDDPEEYYYPNMEDLIDTFSEMGATQIKDCTTTANEAEIGFTYDADLNAFIPPRPEGDYVLNTETYEWDPQ